jgi:hypothetical protein
MTFVFAAQFVLLTLLVIWLWQARPPSRAWAIAGMIAAALFGVGLAAVGI